MIHRNRTIWICVLALVAAVQVSRTQAAPSDAAIITSPQSGPVGTIFELTGSGFPALASGEVTIDGISLGQISSDETGAVRGFFVVPDLRPGPAKVRVAFAKVKAQTTFTVTPE